MPASLRARGSRAMASSQPYDRRSPTTNSAQSENPLIHPHLSRSLPHASPVHDSNPDLERDPETPPDRPGLPTYADYKRIEAEYLQSLSPRKRDKALITQAMFDKIWDVLHQPEACTIETPQFRFWVRKMFSLSRPMYVGDGGWMGTGMYPDMTTSDSGAEEIDLEYERAMMGIIDANASAEYFSAVVLHENRPVAIVEQLYDLFCYCHVRAGHGGRDKTCAVIRQHYSWVPKELTAQFVKACPTCALKRSGHGHGGVGTGVDMGIWGQGRVGQREKRKRSLLGAQEIPVSVVPLSPGNMGWPTTGGPLDPANPELCNVRECERERERAWLRACENTRIVDPSNLPVSPARAFVDASASGSRTRSVTGNLENTLPGWDGVSASPLYLGHTTSVKHSPTRTGLPPLASALSNESLDNLTELGPVTAGECLPPVLRPLRLSGPVPFDTDSDLPTPPSEPYLFQIDPVLLSFNYPGLGLSDSGSSSPGGTGLGMPLALSSTTSAVLSSEVLAGRGHRVQDDTDVVGTCLYRLPCRYPSDCIDVENLNTDTAPPPSGGDSTGRHDSTVSAYGATLERCSSSCRMRRCSSRCGHHDGPFAMLYHHCLADEVGQEFDGTHDLLF